MKWVDTHCHLQLDEREPAQLIERAPNVAWMVVPAVDADSSLSSIELARVHPGKLYPTVGLHPHSAYNWADQADSIFELSGHAVAIGETGLDFYRDLSPREDQISSFTAQARLAVEVDRPLIVHCRDAFSDVYRILESIGVGGRTVLHSWTGGTRWTKRFIELDVMFSFSGTLAFDTAETIRLGAALVPPERALVETDTPYLAPPPHRGERNEPAWVEYVGRALAEVWDLPPEEVARITSENAARVFL